MKVSRSTSTMVIVAVIAGLFSISGFAQDPTDEAAAKINEKFQTQVFQLESGQIITGLVIEETPSLVKVIEQIRVLKNVATTYGAAHLFSSR